MYYIYHIPGVKVGCTDNLKRRTKQNFKYYNLSLDTKVEVLEQTTSTIVADILEYYWHKHLNYGTIPKNERYLASLKAVKNLNSEKANSKKSQYMQGNSHSVGNTNKRHSGKKYIELTSGFIGSHYDMLNKFGNINLNILTKKNSPCTRGKIKGCMFRVIDL